MTKPPPFKVVCGRAVHDIVRSHMAEIIEIVEQAYLAYDAGLAVNPPSCFLRPSGGLSNRIIALPASLRAGVRADGVKWISSVPANLARGLPRASAVLILNDQETGFPLACIEGSIVSSARTAASAALAAARLSDEGDRATSVSFVGSGLIARWVHDFLVAAGFGFDRVGLYDLVPARAAAFGEDLARAGYPESLIAVHPSPEQAVAAAGLVVFATTTAEPYLMNAGCLAHRPSVLHLSLRDLGPDVVLSARNLVDDVDQCLREGTSPYLAEQASGTRDFLDGTLADVLLGRITLERDRPVIFSPFGLGVLDVAVGSYVFELACAEGSATDVPGFFPVPGPHGLASGPPRAGGR
jgi:N-[(2S)-2-amino-2-carboxyethyl]-L-glutamate dehydrogenase